MSLPAARGLNFVPGDHRCLFLKPSLEEQPQRTALPFDAAQLPVPAMGELTLAPKPFHQEISSLSTRRDSQARAERWDSRKANWSLQVSWVAEGVEQKVPPVLMEGKERMGWDAQSIREAMETAGSGPRLCFCDNAPRRKSNLARSWEVCGTPENSGMRNAWVLQCQKPLSQALPERVWLRPGHGSTKPQFSLMFRPVLRAVVQLSLDP